MTNVHEDLEHAVSSLSGSAEHTQTEAVRTLVRIVRGDAAHRPQALTVLEDFTASHRGRPSYRSEPVVAARTVLCAFDTKRAVRSIAATEGTAAVLLAASSATGFAYGGNVLTRFLISLAVVVVLLVAAGATRRFWQPYIGAWAILPQQTRWARAVAVIILATFIERTARAVPGSLTNFLLFGVGTCMVAWLLWLRQPRTAQRR
ncbi:hypothetical protein OOK44_36075 [Streptomyces cellulosae]|uniref:Integral membrane protein n=1 Tax=Streptomyces althioticus TaxID=83380 RepID=A0ABZ1YFN2_9ACTN|nr:hypothetical protein [Streptomyces cellulosae]WTB93421.1 hypothetical protein OIE99_34825 [Streptomyces cellulosae]WTC60812.1 hypothetical protein OH715_36575 [Streptomyces cellulosae]